MKYYFILNPVAGPGKSKDLINDQIKQIDYNFDYEIYLTKGNKDATRFVREVVENNKEEICFIACGGDGTINEVFESCVNKDNVYVSCIPTGSGNDFVKCFKEYEFSVKNILNGTVKKIDAIKVNDRICVNVTNFGIDTAVCIYMNDQRAKRGYGKKSDYLVGVAKSIFTSMKTKAKIYADDKLLNNDDIVTSVTFSNGQYVGGSFNCAPKSKLDDGLIDICVIKANLIQFAKFVGPYSKGKHLDSESMKDLIIYTQAKKIKVTPLEDDFYYTLDGENIKADQIECEIMSKALNFIVPGK